MSVYEETNRLMYEAPFRECHVAQTGSCMKDLLGVQCVTCSWFMRSVTRDFLVSDIRISKTICDGVRLLMY